MMNRTAFLSCSAALLCLATGLSAEEALAFRQTNLPLDQRVKDLVGRLTVDEKIAQMMMATPSVPRLGIPAYHWWNEALHGVARNGIATVFPQAIGLAATWNPALHEQVATVISTEARAKNNALIAKTNGDAKIYQGLTIWSPNINIFRDPRWGRGQETYGEDPYLTGRLAVAFVHGLQGNDPKYLKTVATVKHFAVHSGPEPLRHKFDAKISPRDLWETYLPAFETGIREGGACSLMSAYNSVNGVPASCNSFLLTTVLRERWGFTGAVVGDVDSVKDIHFSHKFTKTPEESSAQAIKAGNDSCSGTTYKALPEALKNGLIKEADLDQALVRLFTLRFRLGQFDPPAQVPYASIPITANDSKANDQVALEAARQSLVLLKNDGTLPWNLADVKTVAVIGPTAELKETVLGNYAGVPSNPSTILAGLRSALEPKGIKVIHQTAAPLAKGFRETGNAIPDGVLFTDDTRATAGLTGQVFNNVTMEGAPLATRTDRQLDLSWSFYQPLPEIPITKASMRWTGVLVAPVSGQYVLGMTVTGSAKLIVDDKTVIDAWKPDVSRSVTKNATFEAGKTYRICVEYAQTKEKGQIQLVWKVPGDTHAIDNAVALAKQADRVVLTLGLTPDLEGEEMPVNAKGFLGGDRTSIMLPSSQVELLDAIAAVGKPFTVVLSTGSALSFDVAKPNAILLSWYHGQRGGDAVAEALLGTTNPGGRLPITFYQSDADLPDFSSYDMTNRTYRYFSGKPLFAFGHGLSYTTFGYGDLALSATSATTKDTLTAKVTVTNTGKVAGDEVVQLYASAPTSKVPMPREWLVGFSRITLKPGEQRTVELTIPATAFRHWDEGKNDYVVDAGTYDLGVGGSSDRLVGKASVTLRAP